MTKVQIANEIKQMTRSDREEILSLILECNLSPELDITSEQIVTLKERIKDIDQGNVKMVDGEKVMIDLSKKYAL